MRKNNKNETVLLTVAAIPIHTCSFLTTEKLTQSLKNRMKLAHSVRARACLRGLTGALTTGLALAGMTWMPSPVWGQWSGGPTGPIYYNGGNVGVGTASPLTSIPANGRLPCE